VVADKGGGAGLGPDRPGRAPLGHRPPACRRDLHYNNGISKELFSEEEHGLSADIEAVRARAGEEERQDSLKSELPVRFEQVARILRDLDVATLWEAADESERRALIEELVDMVTVYPDHLEVTVRGAPPLNVRYSEVGLMESEIVRVRGPTCSRGPRALVTESGWSEFCHAA
jgi:hypothetical protein